MAVTVSRTRAFADTREAFDSVAAIYHQSNAENATLRRMRQRALSMLESHVPGGARVLDLGCGPGTDGEWLAAAGYRVTAVDPSPLMVEQARARIANLGLGDRVEVLKLAIEDIGGLPAGTFDAAYSNFGPLNCVLNLAAAAHLIAERLRGGGTLVASVIGRVCPWELGLYLARGDWRRATARLTRAHVPVPLNGHLVWTRYYRPREFAGIFREAGFATVCQRTLGLFVPPPYMDAFALRHPRLTATLQRIDDTIGGLPGARAWGDHFLIAMRKR